MSLNKLSDSDKKEPQKPEKLLTVQDKIIKEKQYVGYPPKPVGPSVKLLFNELNHNVSVPSRLFDKAVAIILLVPFIILFPFIAVLIKLSSTGPVLTRQTCTGYRGLLFKRFLFRTTIPQPDMLIDADTRDRTFLFGRLLEVTRINEWPSIINVLRGEMKLIGPKARPALTNDYWNNQYSEYYKRFAIEPGLIGVAPRSSQKSISAKEVRHLLKKELEYLLTPDLTTELNILSQRLLNIIIKPNSTGKKLRMNNSG